MLKRFALIFAFFGAIVLNASAQTGTTGTVRTQSYLLQNEFQDGQPSGSITPQYMRDLITSLFPNYLSLKNYGLPTGGDDSTAIQNVINAAATAGVAVYAPAGTYKHANYLLLNGVKLFGDGPTTIFESTNTTTSETTCNSGPCNAFVLYGTGAVLDSIRINTDWNGTRQSSGQSSCVFIDGVDYAAPTQWVVNNVEMHNCASAGVLNNSGTNGEMTNSHNYSSLADAFHNCCGASEVVVSGNYAYSPGDDCYPVVTYASETLTHNITINGNVCISGQARFLVVEGGYNIAFTGNTGQSITSASGIVVGADSGQNNSYGVTVTGNSCYNCGTSNNAAVQIYGTSTSSLNTHDVVFANNTIYAPTADCFTIGSGGNTGSYTYNITLSHNTCDGNGGASGGGAINVNGVTNLTIDGNYFYNLSGKGIGAGSPMQNAGALIITNNTCDKINTSSSGGMRCINLYATEFPDVVITGNHQYNDGGGTLDNWLLLSANSGTINATIDNNYADTTSMSVSNLGNGKYTDPNAAVTYSNFAPVTGLTKFTASGCSNSTTVGSGTAGSYHSGTAGTCTVTITMGNSLTAPNGWACSAFDQTTGADVQHQSASTTTTATITGTTASSDVIVFGCQPY
jgi:hypothetical protein